MTNPPVRRCPISAANGWACVVKVLYFSVAAKAAGTVEESLDTASSLTTDKLWELLIKRHPALAEIRATCRLARNGSFADEGDQFSNQDEVAVLPTFSGG